MTHSGEAIRPRVLLVVAAASGAGKTTLLEALIPFLIASGLRVAAIKRTHHDVDLDVPGKDSDRLRRAGAIPVVLRGPRTTFVVAPTPRSAGDEVDALVDAASAFGPLDLVLVEGGRDLPRHARIEVVAPGDRPMSDRALVVATVFATTDEVQHAARTPAFQRDDAAALSRCIAGWMRDATSAAPKRTSSA